METVRKAINSVMFIALGVMLLAVDIVTAIDPEVAQIISRTTPDEVNNGVAIYNETEWVWYEVATLDNIMGVVFIIGGLIGIGVILYEKHRNKRI